MPCLPFPPPFPTPGPPGICRRALLRTLLAGLGTLISCRTAPHRPLSPDSTPNSPTAADTATFRRRLLRDYRFTSSRTYSEEGIPVFLAGDDSRSARLAPTLVSPETAALSARLAADLRRGATVLADARLASTEEDLGKLVEVFAARDFGSLRKDRNP